MVSFASTPIYFAGLAPNLTRWDFCASEHWPEHQLRTFVRTSRSLVRFGILRRSCTRWTNNVREESYRVTAGKNPQNYFP